ncbi:hypothetical protein [Bradyrhizobium sp. UFLA05-112]
MAQLSIPSAHERAGDDDRAKNGKSANLDPTENGPERDRQRQKDSGAAEMIHLAVSMIAFPRGRVCGKSVPKSGEMLDPDQSRPLAPLRTNKSRNLRLAFR